MASTGEVAAFGRDIQEAYWASLLSTTGFKKPRPNTGVLIGGDVTKPEMKTVAKTLIDLGFKLYCSSPVVEEFLNGIPYVSAKRIFFPKTDKQKLCELCHDWFRSPKYLQSFYARKDIVSSSSRSSTTSTASSSRTFGTTCPPWRSCELA